MSDPIILPNATVIITNHFDVHQDWSIPIPGFFIIASKRKIKSLDEFSDEEVIEFIKLVRKMRKGMREVLNIQDVYIFQNEDTEHWFHLWMFPRYEWMEKFGRKIESVRPIMNHARENMQSGEIFKEVKEDVEKMKKFMEDFRAV